EQNSVAERKNRTLIEAARTVLSGSVFSKQYWTESRISNISFLHVFGCPVYIHNHKDHLGKFDESLNVIKFSKPSVDNIDIAEIERYPLDEYLHPYEPS
ncbi:hypothetical protein Tco_1014773, partial [Tanacetum coccineum]